MNDLRTAPDSPPHASDSDGSLVRFPKTIAALSILPLLVAVVVVGAPKFRRAHGQFSVLRGQVERAAAPGELVYVDSPMLYHLLRWRGSPSLHASLRQLKPGALPPASARHPAEAVFVTQEEPALRSRLNRSGYAVTPDAEQQDWLHRGNGFAWPGAQPFRIDFAVSAAH